MGLYVRLLKFLRPYWVKLVFAMIFMSFVGSTDGLMAYLVQPVMDKIFFEKNGAMLLVIPLGVILLVITKGAFDYLQAYLMGFVGQKIIADIRDLVFRRLQMQPLAFFDKTPTGTIISRITNDVSLVQGAVSDSFTAVLKDAFTIVGLIFVVFYRDWRLAVVAFVVLPVATYPIAAFGRKLRKNSTQNQKAMARFTNFLHETVTGQRIVKAFAMENYEYKRFRQENESLFRIVVKRTRIRALSSPVMERIRRHRDRHHHLVWRKRGDFGDIHARQFLFLPHRPAPSYEPIKRINKENHNIQQGLAAAQRVFEVIDRRARDQRRARRGGFGNGEGIVDFRNVSFKYEEKMVLREHQPAHRQA